jgi:RNA polymerase sigma factor (sigma-70 family)
MDSESRFAPQLDKVETRWSLVKRAHLGDSTDARDARNSLVLRYAPAIRGYVAALTRHSADADELSQDIVVRLIQGDFGGADPARGRFRDLLKISVRNHVRNFWDKQGRRDKANRRIAEEAGSPVASPVAEEDFDSSWRSNLIELGLARLEQYQADNPGNLYFDVLHLRSSHPELDSTALASRLSATRGREINAAGYRQQLKRARTRFAEFLVEEIADGLDQPSLDSVQDELIAVGLLDYIRDVLPEAWQARQN